MDPKTCHDCTYAEAGRKCPGDNPNRYASFGPICEHFNEGPESIRADRDRLAAELARVRRNHLRRMEDAIWEAFDRISPKTDEVQEIALDRLNTLRHRIRAALAQTQDGTTEGRR